MDVLRKVNKTKTNACSMCERTFIAFSHLERHFRAHTGERPFKCEIYHLSLKSQSRVIQHSKLHSNETPFVCIFCERPSKSMQYLKSHIFLQKGETQLLCKMSSVI